MCRAVCALVSYHWTWHTHLGQVDSWSVKSKRRQFLDLQPTPCLQAATNLFCHEAGESGIWNNEFLKCLVQKHQAACKWPWRQNVPTNRPHAVPQRKDERMATTRKYRTPPPPVERPPPVTGRTWQVKAKSHDRFSALSTSSR